jgi:ATP adenylyltransferase
MMLDTLEKALQDGRAPWTTVYLDTRDFTVFEDAYPVTEGHLLIVPKVNDQDSAEKCFRFATALGTQNVDTANNNITGYNIGLNIGTSAGQTVMYPHVHLIFRRDGDMEDPKGGVRGVIPSKQKY